MWWWRLLQLADAMKSKKEDIDRRNKSGMTDDLQGLAWMAHIDSRALDRLVGSEGEETEREYPYMEMEDSMVKVPVIELGIDWFEFEAGIGIGIGTGSGFTEGVEPRRELHVRGGE